MKRNGLQFRDELPALVVMGLFFIIGCAVGGYMSHRLSGDGFETASSMLDIMISGQTEAAMLRRIGESAITVCRLPVAVCALGLTSLAIYGVPVVFALRGFLLTFFLGCFTKVLGTAGLFKALAIVIPSEIFALPCMVMLGTLALLASGRRGYGADSGEYLKKSVRFMCLLAPAILADIFISPLLLKLLA